MKKTMKELQDKTAAILEKEAASLRNEIAKYVLEMSTNPQKDTNILPKKKKKLAVVLTLLSVKREQEKTQKKAA